MSSYRGTRVDIPVIGGIIPPLIREESKGGE
jgi:hypothetical protein